MTRRRLAERARALVALVAKGDSRRADLARAVAVYLATRLGLGVFVWLTGQHFTCHGHRCTDRGLFPHNLLLNGLFQWDAYHYARLATDGYYYGDGFDTTVPYFPGFPAAAWLVGKLVGSPLAGGILVNHLASIAAAYLVARLVRRLEVRDPDGDPGATAREATLFWLASPLAIFSCVFLSEALFGLESVALFWAVAAGNWPLALLAGIGATATRSAGVLVVAAAAVLAWERRRTVEVGWLGAVSLALAPVGLCAFILHQHVALGDGFAWVAVQRRWGRYLVSPLRTLADDWIGFPTLAGRNVDAMYRTQEVLALALTAPLLFLRRRFRIPWGLWLLGAGQWLLALSNHSLISSARYQAANLYFALAIPSLIASRPLLRGLVWMFFGMVLAWYAATYPFGNWAS
jgi:hypothetical protein